MTQRGQQCQPAARRAAADKRRKCIELQKQFVEVGNPYLVFGIPTVERNAGGAAIAAVINQHAIAGLRELLRQGLDPIQTTPPTNGPRSPSTW